MRYLFTVLLCSAFTLSAIAADMMPEEVIVRNAYAKLSYAVDIATVYEAARFNPNITKSELTTRIAQHGLKFKLSDFTVGNVADIADVSFARLFPTYDGNTQEIVHTSIRSYGARVPGGTTTMETLRVKWAPPLSPNGANEYLNNYTVSKMIPILQDELHVSSLERYCSYTVTISLEGRTRTYKAGFFFGKNGGVAPLDPVVGTDGNQLAYFGTHPVFPKLLIQTRTAAIPAVQSFLTEGKKTARASCKSEDACCDAKTLQCGVLSADLLRREPLKKHCSF